ncbi:MAG: hypothetical protein AAGF57_15470 [Pseudomonadota bacterium]
MNNSPFTRATHFSIIWGVTLAVMTLLEWRTLDRDPINHEILSPFIDRTITMNIDEKRLGDIMATEPQAEVSDPVMRYEVEFHFNGPLFLACFFGPILVFHALGALWNRVADGST